MLKSLAAAGRPGTFGRKIVFSSRLTLGRGRKKQLFAAPGGAQIFLSWFRLNLFFIFEAPGELLGLRTIPEGCACYQNEVVLYASKV